MSKDNFNKNKQDNKFENSLATLDSNLQQRYAKLHQQLVRSSSTQISKLNLVKEFETVQAQIQCLSDSIRYMEKNAAQALLNAEL